MGFRARQLSVSLIVAIALLRERLRRGPRSTTHPRCSARTHTRSLRPRIFPNTDGWKVAQPSDAAFAGTGGRVFNDPELNKLEEQLNVSNQTIAAAVAAFYRGAGHGARGAVAVFSRRSGALLNLGSYLTRGRTPQFFFGSGTVERRASRSRYIRAGI